MFLSMHFLPLCVLSAIAPVHCSIALHHCPLHHCIAPLYVLFAIALLCCSIATMLHFIGTFHLTIALFLSMYTLPLHLRPLQLLSLHFYLESLFLLTLQYIHYPNIHYQNVARSIYQTHYQHIYLCTAKRRQKYPGSILNSQCQKLGFHTSEKLLHFYHLTFVGWPLLQNVRDSFFYCLTSHREIIAMDQRQKPDLSNYKKYYDTVVCCDTYCHK